MLKKIITICLISILIILKIDYIQAQDNPNQDELIIFPSPPDTTRIQFLTRYSNSRDIAGKRSRFLKYIFGEEKGKPIIKPYGIAIHDGKIYICDTILAGLEILDLKNSKFDYFQPGGLGKLQKPINCFVDPDGFLYVTDTGRKQVVVFDNQLQYSTSFGDPNKMRPTDVFVRDNEIWICDLGTQKVLVYDKTNYKLIKSIPDDAAKKAESLYSPTNIYLQDDKLFVSDIGDPKIKIFSLTGKFLRAVGKFGDTVGEFARPKGVAVDRGGNFYVVDAGFEVVYIFNKNGDFLMHFGGSYKGPGDMWLPAKVVIDYDNLEYFQKYVYKDFILKYLIFVTNQYGPDKINVYGFIEQK